MKPDLEALKAAVLAMDWEISDRSTSTLIAEARRLKSRHGEDRILAAYFQLLASLSGYVRKNGARSHKNTLALLTSVFYSLEAVVARSDAPLAERQKRLRREIEKFRRLKAEIDAGAGQAGPEKRTAGDIVVTQEMLQHAVEELKTMIRSEIDGLKHVLQVKRSGMRQ